MPDPLTIATLNPGGVSQTAKVAPDSAAAETPKQGPSKFDEVRQAQQAPPVQSAAGAQQIPPLQTQITAEQRKVVEADLRKRLDSSRGIDPKAIFKPDMKSARVEFDALHRKAQAIPPGPAADALKDRLSSLDSQFQDSGKLLDSMTNLTSPGDMLKFQVQMYQFSQNMQLMSNVVEQVTGGAKQLLQTQV